MTEKLFNQPVCIYKIRLGEINPGSKQPFFKTLVTERVGQVMLQVPLGHRTHVVWENGNESNVRDDLQVYQLSTRVKDVRGT